MPRFMISIPHPYAGRVGGKGTGKDGSGKVPTQQINVEAKTMYEAKTKLVDFGIPWAAANSFAGGKTSKYTKDSGTKLESLDPKTGTVKGGTAGFGNNVNPADYQSELDKGRYGEKDPSNPNPFGGEMGESAWAGSASGGSGVTSGAQRDLIEQLEAIGLVEPGAITRGTADGSYAGTDSIASDPSRNFSESALEELFNRREAQNPNAPQFNTDPRFNMDDYGNRGMDGEDNFGGGGTGIPGGFGGITEGSTAFNAGFEADLATPFNTDKGVNQAAAIKTAAELAAMFPGTEMSTSQSAVIDAILSGEMTPDQLEEVMNDPTFKGLFDHPEWGPILNPAIELAVTNATEQLKVSGGITEADAGASNAGALLRSGATTDEIMQSIRVGATGQSTDAGALNAARINASGGFTDVQDMLKQQRIAASGGYNTEEAMQKAGRIAASGGLDNNLDIRGVLQAQAANNAFGSLQLGDGTGEKGSRLAEILQIINAQNSGATGQNQVQREANYLQHMGNPEALGVARAAGLDIPNPFEEQKAALEADAAAPSGTVSANTAMRALEAQDPNSGLGNIPYQEDKGMNQSKYSTGANISSPQTVPSFPAPALSSTSSIGSLKGLGSNFTEGQYDNRSNAERGQIRGQLAQKQGIGRDEVEKRSRSFTPGSQSTKRTLV